MARRQGIRVSDSANYPGAPGTGKFIPTNGAGPGQQDPRSVFVDSQGNTKPIGNTDGTVIYG